jgi:transcription termination factor NusB
MSTLNAPGESWQFRVRHFGVDAKFDYDNYDLDPEYVTNFLNKVVDSVEQIELLISPIVDNADSLVEPRECGCPM